MNKSYSNKNFNDRRYYRYYGNRPSHLFSEMAFPKVLGKSQGKYLKVREFHQTNCTL